MKKYKLTELLKMENKNVSTLAWCIYNKKTLEIFDYFFSYDDAQNFRFNKGLKNTHKVTNCNKIADLRHERKIYLCRYHQKNIEGVKNSLFLEFRDEMNTKFRPWIKTNIPELNTVLKFFGVKECKKTCWEGVQWCEFYLFSRVNYPKNIFNPIYDKQKYLSCVSRRFTKKLES